MLPVDRSFKPARVVAAFVLAAFLASSAAAEVLARLHITVLTLAVDRARISMHSVVHLTLHAHTTQRITQLDNVALPELNAFDVMGDERHISPAAAGTEYREVLTLAPKRAGTFVIGPASIDAINTQTNLPSRFSSNTVTLRVAPFAAASAPADAAWEPQTVSRKMLINFFIGLMALLGAAVIGFAGLQWWLSRRRRPKPIPPIVTPPPDPVAVEPGAPDPQLEAVQRFAAYLAAVKRDPSHNNAQGLRLALRDALGAAPNETLADLIARTADGERGLFARALRAAERAAFIDQSGRTTAVEESLDLFDATRQRLETRI